MPCAKPVITDSLEDCCFTCFDAGRAPYLAPLAVVLHEYDGHIEELNNEMESCCNLPQGCHSSFHYGVGDGGQVYNWVDPADVAWSFHPIRTDADCGVCDWSFGISQGFQHPNLYTINIAVATGTSGIVSGRRWPNNVFSDDQYKTLVRLVGWLAETYGIDVNQNMIWRHCDELKDFPSLCPGDCTYSDFLQDVQNCVDEDAPDPLICDILCDMPASDGSPAYVLGTDEECNNCGRYRLDSCSLIEGLGAGIFEEFYLVGVDSDGECIAMPVPAICDTTEVINTVFGLNSNGVPGFYQTKQRLTHRDAGAVDALLPATDRIINLDAETENVVFNLAEPGPCDPTDFWIKRMDCNQDNTCAVNGVTANIDGEPTIFLGTPGPIGRRGEAIHIYWNGVEWEII